MNETKLDRLLAAIPVEPLPRGFRDRVMRRVAAPSSVTWEWIAAAALALPSLVYVGWVFSAYGGDFMTILGNLADALQGTVDVAGFFVDGLVVLAVAMCGLASILAAHALAASNRRPLAR